MSPEDPLLFPTFPRTQRSIAGDQSRKETRRRDEKNEVSETHRVDFFYDIFFLTFFFLLSFSFSPTNIFQETFWVTSQASFFR